MSIKCKKCGCPNYVKNGQSSGKQRYRCKKCVYNYVCGDLRRKYSLADFLYVIKLYLENTGIRSIERLTGIRASQVSLWIKKAASLIRAKLAKESRKINDLQDVEVMEVDELCTWVKKSQKTEANIPSYGLLLIEGKIKLLILK